MKILLFIFITLITVYANASELTSVELNQYCKEVNKNSNDNSFNRDLAQRCKGYMAGFFDSMIVVDKLTGKKAFCIPRMLPKTQSNLILSTWIQKNQEIAPKTTASVALYAAFKQVFPCG